MLPPLAVLGVGAVVEPVPFVAVVYQSKFEPDAVSTDAVAPWQYANGLVIVGADGVAFTVTVIAVLGLSHPDVV